MKRTVIHLIRHGEVANPGRIRYGRLPGYVLSDRGRRQATEAASHIKGLSSPDAIVTSPLERAVETATLLAESFSRKPLLVDPRVTEAASEFEGLPLDAPKSPRYWSLLANPIRPSWGEPFHEIAGRMAGAIYDLARQYRGGSAVIVSHQSPIWLARIKLSGWRLPPWLRGPVSCHHASVSTLWFEGLRFITWWYWRSRV